MSSVSVVMIKLDMENKLIIIKRFAAITYKDMEEHSLSDQTDIVLPLGVGVFIPTPSILF